MKRIGRWMVMGCVLFGAAGLGACDSGPSAPETGDLTVVITGLPSGASGSVRITGPNSFARTITTTETLVDLAPGQYAVVASVVTAAGETFGALSPSQSVAVAASGATASVEYVSLRSALSISITGVPAGANASVIVDGPDGYQRTFSASGLVAGLAPGAYTVSASGVVAGDSTYQAQPERLEFEISATSAAAAAIQYRAVAHRTFNMTISTMYLVQAVQTLDRMVPIVAGRDAYLRVFARGDQQNTAIPSLRVRFYQGSSLVGDTTLPFADGTLPTTISQATLSGNWTVHVPANLVAPGLRVEAELDPSNAIIEGNESDNRFPATGGSLQIAVQDVPPLRIRLIPVHQTANGLTGSVSADNKDAFLAISRKILPIATIDADLRAPYTVNGPAFDPAGSVWSAIVSELDAVRIAEGSGRYYYGVVRTEYAGGGVVGIAAGIPSRTSLGWDRFPEAPNTLAHELGHNFNRRHVPCGGTAGNDPQYPYPTGMIGSFGMDTDTKELKTPTEFTDIMGYCDAKWWISDYTFVNVLNYRAQADAAMTLTEEQPALLVWGRIIDGEPILEPAFRVVTRPVLPRGTGAYRVEGVATDGSTLFQVSFDGEHVAHADGDQRIFSFAIPMTDAAIADLMTLRLSGGGRSVALGADAPGAPAGRRRIAPFENFSVREERAGAVSVEWDASAHPAVMVRDARTREVLTIARGGRATVLTEATELELVPSDGVSGGAQRVRVGSR